MKKILVFMFIVIAFSFYISPNQQKIIQALTSAITKNESGTTFIEKGLIAKPRSQNILTGSQSKIPENIKIEYPIYTLGFIHVESSFLKTSRGCSFNWFKTDNQEAPFNVSKTYFVKSINIEDFNICSTIEKNLDWKNYFQYITKSWIQTSLMEFAKAVTPNDTTRWYCKAQIQRGVKRPPISVVGNYKKSIKKLQGQIVEIDTKNKTFKLSYSPASVYDESLEYTLITFSYGSKVENDIIKAMKRKYILNVYVDNNLVTEVKTEQKKTISASELIDSFSEESARLNSITGY